MEIEMMSPIVDYFSFSIPIPRLWSQYQYHIQEGIPFDAPKNVKRLCNYIASSSKLIELGGKSVYDRRLHAPLDGFTYFDGEKASTSLIQITGVGCERLRNEGRLEHVLHDWQERATRIDIAVDIKSMCDVEGFARAYSNRRFKFGGHIESETGITWYVGTPDSDRHARVYRYNPPAPRSDTLRIEYELHDKVAKRATRDVLERGADALGWDLGATFGWTHEHYIPPTEGQKLPSISRPSNYSNTARWLATDVISACRKMAQRGELSNLIAFESSLRAIIEEYSCDEGG